MSYQYRPKESEVAETEIELEESIPQQPISVEPVEIPEGESKVLAGTLEQSESAPSDPLCVNL